MRFQYNKFTDSYPTRLALAIALLLLVGACKKKVVMTEVRVVNLGSESFVVASEGVIESGPMISGTLAPKESATVRAQIGGAVLQTFVQQGQPVHPGTILATIDARSLSDQVASAKSAITNAESSLSVAQREEKREEALVKIGAMAEKDVDNAKKNSIAAEAQVVQAKAMLVSAEKQQSNATVTSSINGIVSEKQVSTGDVVQPGSAMFTIVNPSSLELEGSVPAEALNLIHVGLPVKFSVTGYPGQAFLGTVTRMNPSADPMTRQVRIYAEIPNTGHNLVGGLYAEGRIASELKTALSVPTSAIDRRLIRPSVERIKSGRVDKVDVTTGTLDERNNMIQILSGIEPGDTVLIGAAQTITPGTQIRIIANTVASATPANVTMPSDTTRAGAK